MDRIQNDHARSRQNGGSREQDTVQTLAVKNINMVRCRKAGKAKRCLQERGSWLSVQQNHLNSGIHLLKKRGGIILVDDAEIDSMPLSDHTAAHIDQEALDASHIKGKNLE